MSFFFWLTMLVFEYFVLQRPAVEIWQRWTRE